MSESERECCVGSGRVGDVLTYSGGIRAGGALKKIHAVWNWAPQEKPRFSKEDNFKSER